MYAEVPTVRELKRRGKFFGYRLPGFYETWRIGKILYSIIDGVSKDSKGKNKHWEYVELCDSIDEKFYAGFHPHDGTPLKKE